MTDEKEKTPEAPQKVAVTVKKSKLPWILVGGGCCLLPIIIIVIIVVATGGAVNEATKTTTNNETTKEATKTPTKVDTTAFIAEFDNNQLAAEDKYKDKYIEFTAVIKNISSALGSPYLSLAANADAFTLSGIQCSFSSKDALTSLSNGQTVTLQGTVKNQTMGSVTVDDCKVIK